MKKIIRSKELINEIVTDYKNGLGNTFIKEKYFLSNRSLYEILHSELDLKKIERKPKERRIAKHIDKIGEKYHNLLIKDIQLTDKSKDRSFRGICICDCGREADVNISYLIRGLTKTCGHKDCEYHRQDYSNSGKKNIKFTGYEEISGMRWASIRLGAERRKIDFNITVKYAWDLFIEQNCKCAMTGRNIFFGKTNSKESTASLDRIDSSKGYIESNVQWLHKDVNIMKWDFSIEEFKKICKEIVDYEKG